MSCASREHGCLCNPFLPLRASSWAVDWRGLVRAHTHTRQALPLPRPSSPPYSPHSSPSAPPPSSASTQHPNPPPTTLLYLLRLSVPPFTTCITHTLRFARRHRRRCHSGSGFVAWTRLPRTTHLNPPPPFSCHPVVEPQSQGACQWTMSCVAPPVRLTNMWDISVG